MAVGALAQCINHDYGEEGIAPPRVASLSHNNNTMMPNVIVEADRKNPSEVICVLLLCNIFTLHHHVSLNVCTKIMN